MTPVVVLFVSLAAFAFGAFAGWFVRERLERGEDVDPAVELRSLREVHSACSARIRQLHLELAQLETRLSLARVEQQPRRPQVAVSDDEVAGAARLASLIDALESSSQPDGEEEGTPAAFMSILPGDLVEEETARTPVEGSPRSGRSVLPGSGDEGDGIVVSIEDGGGQSIEVDVRGGDDLTAIKGIGPKIQSILNEHGITTFRQLAELDEEQFERLGDALGAFRGRIERDDWVGAAERMLAESAGR